MSLSSNTGVYYIQDNISVYQKLRTWFSTHKVSMEHIRMYEQIENGREAHEALV